MQVEVKVQVEHTWTPGRSLPDSMSGREWGEPRSTRVTRSCLVQGRSGEEGEAT